MVILFVVGEQSRAELLSVIMRVLVRVLAPSQTLTAPLSRPEIRSSQFLFDHRQLSHLNLAFVFTDIK